MLIPDATDAADTQNCRYLPQPRQNLDRLALHDALKALSKGGGANVTHAPLLYDQCGQYESLLSLLNQVA